MYMYIHVNPKISFVPAKPTIALAYGPLQNSGNLAWVRRGCSRHRSVSNKIPREQSDLGNSHWSNSRNGMMFAVIESRDETMWATLRLSSCSLGCCFFSSEWVHCNTLRREDPLRILFMNNSFLFVRTLKISRASFYRSGSGHTDWKLTTSWVIRILVDHSFLSGQCTRPEQAGVNEWTCSFPGKVCSFCLWRIERQRLCLRSTDMSSVISVVPLCNTETGTFRPFPDDASALWPSLIRRNKPIMPL